MLSLRKFLILSFICHAVLILALVEVHLTGKKPDASDVYEVSIVAGAPAGGAGASPGVSAPQAKKFVFNQKREHATLGEVKKEKAGREPSPRFNPVEPEAPGETQEPTNAGSAARSQGPAGPGQGRGQGGGTPSEIALWKMKVRSMVNGLWKTPPEIEVMDKSLMTTYLLKVSKTGDLLSKKLMVSSGNVPFDRSILIALGRVNRFPPPPLILIAGEESVEITMSFTPP
jgi:hypothetical protein